MSLWPGLRRVVVGFEVVEQLADCDVVFVYEVEAFGRVVFAAADLVALFAPFGAFPAIGIRWWLRVGARVRVCRF